MSARVGQRVADAAPDQRVVVAQDDLRHAALPNSSGHASPRRVSSNAARAAASSGCSGTDRISVVPRGAAGQVDPAADRAGTLVQAADAEAAGLGQVVLRQAAAVVADFQRQHAAGQRQVDRDTRRLGVLADVGERLLRRAIGHQRHARRAAAGVSWLVRNTHVDAGAPLEAAAPSTAAPRTRPCSRMAGRRLCMIRWLASMACVTVSSADCTRCCTSGTARVARDPGEVELQRRERAADIVVDLARDRRALHLDAGLQVLRQLGQALRARRRARGRRASRARRVSLASMACSIAGDQPRQVVLQQVVAGAVAHRLDRRVLADLARDEDEGQQAAARASACPAPPGRRSRAGCSRTGSRPSRSPSAARNSASDSMRRACDVAARRAAGAPAPARGRARSLRCAARAGSVGGRSRLHEAAQYRSA